MELTIVCWLWNGWNPVYGPADVHKLQRNLKKHMSVPFRFVCITDTPEGLECETYPLWSFPEIDQEKRREVLGAHTKQNFKMADCFRRLKLFDPEVNRQFGDYVVSIDLDCEIFGDLWPLFKGGETFRITQGGGRAPYCGTMWVLKTGEHANVWRDFDPATVSTVLETAVFAGLPIVGSDQAWLSVTVPDAPVWTESDGVYLLRSLMVGARPQPENCRVVFSPGRIKLKDDNCRLFAPWLYKAACSP